MLLIGAVLLGGFIVVFERNSETSWQQQRRTRTVFAVYPDSIEQILIERNGVQIECTLRNGIWRLTRPADAPVDTAIVRKMIAGMARVERGELIPAETLRDRGLAPSDYGFDTPRARITFKNSRGTFTWLIGRDAPLGDSLYVMEEGGTDIIAAAQTLLNILPEDPAWIRDRTLFAGEPAAVRGIDLRRAGGFLQLRHPENNGWIMQQPYTGRADIQAVNGLIENIFASRIGEFITDDKADLTAYGLETPALELTVYTRDGKTQTLFVGRELPDTPDALYAKRVDSDSIFTVPSVWAEGLTADASSLRSRRLLDLPAERITSLLLTRNEQPVEILKSNALWQIIRPARWAANPAHVNELIRSLAEASIEDFVDEPPAAPTAETNPADLEITLTAGDESRTFLIGPPETNGLRRVRCTQENAHYAVNASVVREDFTDPLFYRDPVVLELSPAQIEKISVRTGDAEQSVRKTETGTFSSENPRRILQSGPLSDLMWSLNDLRVERYVAFNPESLTPYGLDQPHTSLTITLSGTNALGRIILLGAPADGGRFAMIQGQDIVFILSDETAQTLTTELTLPAETE